MPPSTKEETVVEGEEDREKHWERVRVNEKRLLEQRRLVEKMLKHRFYPR